MMYQRGSGKPIYFNAQHDLTEYDTVGMLIRSPSGRRTIEVTPTIVDQTVTVDGIEFTADEYVSYAPVSTDFPENGDYRLQLRVTKDSGAYVDYSAIAVLSVGESLSVRAC